MPYRAVDLCDTRNLHWPVDPDLYGMSSVRGVGQIRNSTMSCHRLTLARPHRHVVLARAPFRGAEHSMTP